MSGGGGSSSDGGGGNDMQVSGMEAALSSEKGISTYSDTRTGSTRGYEGSDAGFAANDNSYAGVTPSMSSINPNTGKFESGGFTDSDDEYDAPDKAHYSQTQKDIATTNKELAKNDQTDIKMSKEEYDQFNKNLNDYYGTKNVKYEPYGRAGKGTVNLSFNEHYNNVITQNPALKFSPSLAFLTAAGRNVSEYLTSDYGTYKYAGPGTDSGGLLGSGKRTQQQTERELMRNIAPDAPYIVSGLDKPDSSPAADFFAKINKNKNELFFQDQYDSAKAKMQGILGSPSPMRYLAISESPFYGWLKKNNLDKGIL